MFLSQIASGLAHILYPPVCMGCRTAVGSDGALCPHCWAQAPFLERPVCDVLGLPFPYDPGEGAVSPLAIAKPPVFDRARAAMLHEGVGARLVAQLKYSDRTDLAIAMALWMERAGTELIAEADALVPVPLHRNRLVRRRFNQAAELARHLSHRTRIPYRPLALERVKATASQVGLGAKARARNVRGAFAVAERRRHEVEGRRILLVDDVFTTGSTVSSAARALKRAGALRVDVLTFSRVAENAL